MADALHIAGRFSKAQILEMYLNAVYFGEGAYGVGQAARAYFHRPVEALDLARSALLAGLPRGPSAYDPLCHPRAARERLREVLAAMVRTRAISRGAAAGAARDLAAWLAARPPGRPLPGAGRPGRSCAMPRGPVLLRPEALPATVRPPGMISALPQGMEGPRGAPVRERAPAGVPGPRGWGDPRQVPGRTLRFP